MLLGRVPESLHRLQAGLFESSPLGRQTFLDEAEPSPELAIRACEGGLWVDPQLAPQIDEREEEVAQLLGEIGLRWSFGRVQELPQLADLLFDLVEDASDVGPVEADSRGLLTQAVGGEQSG